MDATSIQALFASLKSMSDIVSAMLDLRDAQAVQSKVIDFQRALIAAQNEALALQGEQSTLIERIRGYEQQIMQLKDWQHEARRYALRNPHTGCTVYAVKREMADGEPPHYLCANCYQQGRKSFLQHAEEKEGWSLLACGACKTTARTGHRGASPRHYAEDLSVDTQ